MNVWVRTKRDNSPPSSCRRRETTTSCSHCQRWRHGHLPMEIGRSRLDADTAQPVKNTNTDTDYKRRSLKKTALHYFIIIIYHHRRFGLVLCLVSTIPLPFFRSVYRCPLPKRVRTEMLETSFHIHRDETRTLIGCPPTAERQRNGGNQA